MFLFLWWLCWWSVAQLLLLLVACDCLYRYHLFLHHYYYYCYRCCCCCCCYCWEQELVWSLYELASSFYNNVLLLIVFLLDSFLSKFAKRPKGGVSFFLPSFPFWHLLLARMYGSRLLLYDRHLSILPQYYRTLPTVCLKCRGLYPFGEGPPPSWWCPFRIQYKCYLYCTGGMPVSSCLMLFFRCCFVCYSLHVFSLGPKSPLFSSLYRKPDRQCSK